MSTPPDPGIPALLLAVAAKLGWRATTRGPSAELGTFADGSTLLLAAGDGPGTVQWALGAAAPGCAPCLLSEATHTVLHGGTLNASGAVDYQGRAYRVRLWWDGANLTAEAVAEDAIRT